MRPVLYQLGRSGDRFTVGDGPLDLATMPRPLFIGRLDAAARPGKARIAVNDPWMHLHHARIVEGTRSPTQTSGGVRLFIEEFGSKNGVVVNGAVSPRIPLIHGDIIETGRTFWAFVEDRGSEPLLTSPVEMGGIATWHPRLGQDLGRLIAAPATDHVLVTGLDGTGKGFLARTLHQVSRREQRFVHRDCGEPRPRKIVVDLFGAEGGPQGKLRDTGSGTLLLENIDLLSPALQERLASALRAGAFIPDGKARSVRVDLRLVGTISRSAQDANVLGGLVPALRDLLTTRVDLPSLEERACDLGLLLDDFLSRAKGCQSVAGDVCRVLFRHRFAQQVRGFGRVVDAAASLAVEDRGGKAGSIELRHLPFAVAGADATRAMLAHAQRLAVDDSDTNKPPVLSTTGDDGQPLGDPSVLGTPSPERPVDVDIEALVAALKNTRGNLSATAQALGCPRALLLRWLRDLNVDPLSYR